jgi:RNA polymerase sigma factor (sigma-70 family)
MPLKAGRGLEGWEIATIKKLVNEARRWDRHLEREEFDDLVQDCLAHWLVVRSRLPASGAGPPAVSYLATVTRNKLRDMIRGFTADKRAGDPGAFSLETPIGEADDDLTLGDVLAQEQDGGGEAGGIDSRHARIDLERVLALLTPEQQRLCRLLGEEGLSIKEAAEQLGLARATIYDHIRRIRRVFEEHGLANYLRG